MRGEKASVQSEAAQSLAQKEADLQRHVAATQALQRRLKVMGEGALKKDIIITERCEEGGMRVVRWQNFSQSSHSV